MLGRFFMKKMKKIDFIRIGFLFIVCKTEKMKNITEIEKELLKIQKQKEIELKNGNYEMIAHLRDKELDLQKQIQTLKNNLQ
jgi:hypothetical protein